VRFEDTEQSGGQVGIKVQVPVEKNVRLAGEDLRKGTLAVAKGSRIRPQEVGMFATVGRQQVLVTRRPRVAILATGDEVVDIDAALMPGKIRNANSYSNAAQVLRCGGEPVLLGIARDQVDDLTSKIRSGLEQGVDLFLTSGGVSVGDFDVVKKVLAAEGDMSFWRVRMKPGKPFAFGQIDGVPLLGLPGNPVSAMISFELFARPAILKMLGIEKWHRPMIEATLMDPVKRKDERRHYLRVSVRKAPPGAEGRAEGGYLAYLTGGQGSGILSSMVLASGVAVIPEDAAAVAAGTQVRVIMLDWE
jgi:molybdopterin molybdotransferase